MKIGRYARKNMLRSLSEAMDQYMVQSVPWEMDPMEIYKHGFEPEHWNAYKIIRKSPMDIFYDSTSFRCQVEDRSITIPFPRGQRHPRVHIENEILPEGLRVSLAEWYNKAKVASDIASDAHDRLFTLLQCYDDGSSAYEINTVRQLYAVWPEVFSILSGKFRETIRGTKVKPRLPKGWDDVVKRNGDVLYPKNLDDINNAICVAALLDNTDTSHYPSLM